MFSASSEFTTGNEDGVNASSSRPPEPRVLPGNRDVLIIATEANVGAVAVCDLNRLALGKRKRNRRPDARAGLPGLEVANTVDCGNAPPPKITVERGPQPRPAKPLELRYVIAQVPLEAANGSLRLWPRHWDVVIRRIGRVEPDACIAVEDPIAPTL